MKSDDPIDWPARRARAVAWLDDWRREAAEALRQRRPMRLPTYDYQDNPPPPGPATGSEM